MNQVLENYSRPQIHPQRTNLLDCEIVPDAYVLIKCDEETEDIFDNLSRKGVRDFQPTVGHYDFVARVSSESTELLDEMISEIHSHDKIRSTKVLKIR